MASPVLTLNKNFQQRSNGFTTVSSSSRLMSTENVIQKAAITLGLVVVGAIVGWIFPILYIPGLIVGFILGLVNSFKKEPSVPLIVSYAVFEGLVVGGISATFDRIWPGVASQAVLATFAVAAVILTLFATGKIRATKRLNKIWLVAIFSYLAFGLLNIILSVTGVMPNAFGVHSIHVFGIPLGVIIGAVAVLIASYSLVMDFTLVENGVQNRLPEKYGWQAAFGITVTMVWLYLEILRILALARN